MTSSARCDAVQERISDAWLARGETAPADREHARGCEACGAHERELVALARAFSADAPPLPNDALVAATLRRASDELARRAAARAAPPEGWRRELGRLVAAAALPLPVVLAWNAAVLTFGGQLLEGLLPVALIHALGAAYVLAGATWLGCLYGSLPLVAARTLRRRALESPT
jgi:hypothetical protein